MPSRKRKSWREKLADDKGLPKVGEVSAKMSRRWGQGTMVIPAPREVDAVMRGVPRGRLITNWPHELRFLGGHFLSWNQPLDLVGWIVAHEWSDVPSGVWVAARRSGVKLPGAGERKHVDKRS